jgi:hypothetical protein
MPFANTPDPGRNDVRLLVELDGAPVSHFRLREFENRDGLAMVHSGLLLALERLRRELCVLAAEPVWVIITDAVRTRQDLAQLAQRLGWSDEGGLVSRTSRHLADYGGIAVDIIAVVARNRERIPQRELGDVCRRHFDFVKDDYRDGHVHVDMRDSIQHR